MEKYPQELLDIIKAGMMQPELVDDLTSNSAAMKLITGLNTKAPFPCSEVMHPGMTGFQYFLDRTRRSWFSGLKVQLIFVIIPGLIANRKKFRKDFWRTLKPILLKTLKGSLFFLIFPTFIHCSECVQSTQMIQRLGLLHKLPRNVRMSLFNFLPAAISVLV